MIDGKTVFDKPIKITYENIRKIATSQGDDYTTSCLLDYIYVKDYYRMIAIDLRKQQTLDADPRAIKQINFTENLDRAGNTRIYFISWRSKRDCFELTKRNHKSFVNAITSGDLIFYQHKMTQYNSLNVKLSNSQLNKLKSAIKNETGVVSRLSLNVVGDDETNFPHKLLLINRQVKTLRKALASKSSTDINLSKTQLSKMVQSRGFLGRLLVTRIANVKNVTKPLA